MAEPVRVQQSRKRGWRKPGNTVVVSRPSKWGNPYQILRSPFGNGWLVRLPQGDMRFSERDAIACAVYLFRCSLNSGIGPEWQWMRDHLADLRGKNLACWCPLPKPGEPDLCHAAVLLEVVANG